MLTQIKKRTALQKPKRVAAYARVSCGKDAMLHSLSAQVSYYSDMIQVHEGWQYTGVYADEALTGTKEDRAEFQRLLSDCRAGLIDLVITKSISRFARNTVTLLQTVRELKSLGVDIIFEEQNIHTMSTEGELMLTILASYAQAESLSASENQKWRIRKSFENGELINMRFLFGYRMSEDQIEIDPVTAPVVKEIFNRAIDGESFGSIGRDLNERGIYGALGGKWSVPRIREIFKNEKYTGNAMLQKSYRNNHLEKKRCRNTGELPMYYAEETHPAIITEETFKATQTILQENRNAYIKNSKPKTREFTGLIFCSRCGKNYKRVTNNNTPGWNCSTYVQHGKAYCQSKKIPDTALKAACVDALRLKDYDAAIFTEHISRIEIPGENRLVFIFKDGRTEERTWADRSRRDSWNVEMKQAAVERTRRINDAKSYNDTGDEE